MRALKGLIDYLVNPRGGYAGFADADSLAGEAAIHAEAPGGRRRGWHINDILLNLPLMVGGLIVLALFAMVLFGPLFAPVNPYIEGRHIVDHFDSEKGVWVSPPLEPSQEYPLGTDEWGNDILSMLLYGARNTLVASAFITMVRVLLGTFLGGIAGWNEGKLIDQIIMGTIGVITSIPMLILAMILIFALDIRRGLPVFIAALAVVGWTEIAQYIRSEFMVIHKMPYIEGAQAVGSRSFAIAVRHVLPNILPHLLVITFLEVGAVLMLLGELGFVGVYIGGGSRIALGDDLTGLQVVALAEVPEWGAMLAEGYRWLRAKPFVILPPAVAFFVAVVGFNAFGEGLRRLIETSYINTSFLLRKRMLLVIAALTAGTVFIINNTGPAPWYVRVAQAFDANSALTHARALANMDGRGVGQTGGFEAAEYIAAQFEAYGLQGGWSSDTFIYPMAMQLVRPIGQPHLEILNSQGDVLADFRHQVDFGYLINGHGGSGTVEYPLTLVGFDTNDGGLGWEAYKGLDLRDQIVVLVEGNAPADFPTEALIRGARGVLWIASGEGADMRSHMRVSDTQGVDLIYPQIPIYRIHPRVAEQIFEADGRLLGEIFAQRVGEGDGWFAEKLSARAGMSLELGEPALVEVPSVLGIVPGSDYSIVNDLVVVYASYDWLGIEPDGTVLPGSASSAVDIGMMLEIARVWQQAELDARRSVLFVAWGAGSLQDPGIEQFLASREAVRYLPTPRSQPAMRPRIIFQWEQIGTNGDRLYIPAGSDQKLRELFLSELDDGLIEVSNAETEGKAGNALRLNGAKSLYLTWTDEDKTQLRNDTNILDADRLGVIGEALSFTLTQVVRQASY